MIIYRQLRQLSDLRLIDLASMSTGNFTFLVRPQKSDMCAFQTNDKCFYSFYSFLRIVYCKLSLSFFLHIERTQYSNNLIESTKMFHALWLTRWPYKEHKWSNRDHRNGYDSYIFFEMQMVLPKSI